MASSAGSAAVPGRPPGFAALCGDPQERIADLGRGRPGRWRA